MVTRNSSPDSPGPAKHLRRISTRGALATILGTILAVTLAVAGTNSCAAAKPPTYARVKVHRTVAKEAGGFTQGLEVRNGVVYESVGLYGGSEIRSVEIKTGKVTKRVALDPQFFAEGMTIVPGADKSGKSDKIVQLTWKEKTAIVRDVANLGEVGRLSYKQEGWGICYSPKLKALIHSDGSSTLYVRDPKSFAERRRIEVRMPDGTPATQLNELDCQTDTVFANVWQQSNILEIDSRSGIVRRSIDASSLVPSGLSSPDDVLNGIASLGNGRFLVTGKRWPTYFEVSFENNPG